MKFTWEAGACLWTTLLRVQSPWQFASSAGPGKVIMIIVNLEFIATTKVPSIEDTLMRRCFRNQYINTGGEDKWPSIGWSGRLHWREARISERGANQRIIRQGIPLPQIQSKRYLWGQIWNMINWSISLSSYLDQGNCFYRLLPGYPYK